MCILRRGFRPSNLVALGKLGLPMAPGSPGCERPVSELLEIYHFGVDLVKAACKHNVFIDVRRDVVAVRKEKKAIAF